MSEEEKTIEEQTETIIDAIETEDDVREAFEINKEDGPLPALGAPLIRALGDPDPADPNMIQKHLDNFLAKIAGETPIDENVRDSTEYWLNRIGGAIPTGSGGFAKIEKIWQNPDPTAVFNPQYINIDTSAYSLLMIEIARSTGAPSVRTFGFCVPGNSVDVLIVNAEFRKRTFTVATDKITVSAGVEAAFQSITSGFAVTNNSGAVPIAIYGIKY